MSAKNPRTPEAIISSLAKQQSIQISKFETELFHRHLESIGFAHKYNADVDITSWSDGQDSYVISHLGVVSFVAFEPGKDVLNTNGSDSQGEAEDLDSEALTEDELRRALMKLATGINSTRGETTEQR